MRIWRRRLVTAYFSLPSVFVASCPPAVGGSGQKQRDGERQNFGSIPIKLLLSTKEDKKVGGNVGVGAKLETSSKSSSSSSSWRHGIRLHRQSSRKLINTRPLSLAQCDHRPRLRYGREQTLVMGRSLIPLRHLRMQLQPSAFERPEEASDLFDNPPTC